VSVPEPGGRRELDEVIGEVASTQLDRNRPLWLMSKIAGDTVQVNSAGTKPGTAVNDLSAQALAEVGVDITGNTPHTH
jgi:hypothetical protein